MELRLGYEVIVLLTNLQIINWDIFRLYQSMVKVTMVLFLMPKGPNWPEGYVIYGTIFIPWLTGYLRNYIGYFPCQLGYIILEWLHLVFLKLLQPPMQAQFVIQSYQILSMLKVENLALIIG